MPKKPKSGGTPARLNNRISIASARPGSAREYIARLRISVTGCPSRSIDRIKAKVPTFIVT